MVSSHRRLSRDGHIHRQPVRWGERAIQVLFALALLILFTACSAGSTGSQASGSPTAKISPAPGVPPGTVLYKADWSRGLSDWGNTKGWKIVDGMALSDTSVDNAITVPYIPSVRNYAIECRFQVVRVPRTGGYFVIKAPHKGDADGYTAGILGLFAPGARTSPYGNPEGIIYLEPTGDMQAQVAPIDYDPHYDWHTFRVQVKGPAADLFIDGSDSSTAVREQGDQISNGPLQLVSSGAVVRVASVTVIAL